jgi:hypothetical protein
MVCRVWSGARVRQEEDGMSCRSGLGVAPVDCVRGCVVGDAGFVLWVTLSNRAGLSFTAASRAWLGNVVIVGLVGHICQPGVSPDR